MDKPSSITLLICRVSCLVFSTWTQQQIRIYVVNWYVLAREGTWPVDSGPWLLLCYSRESLTWQSHNFIASKNLIRLMFGIMIHCDFEGGGCPAECLNCCQLSIANLSDCESEKSIRGRKADNRYTGNPVSYPVSPDNFLPTINKWLWADPTKYLTKLTARKKIGVGKTNRACSYSLFGRKHLNMVGARRQID